jgi:two-component sensor histidine kinase
MRSEWVQLLSARVRANRTGSFLFALCMVVLAVAVRFGFSGLGATLNYASFFPAILLTAFVAGPIPALLVTIVVVVITWWAFMPPAYAFGPLSPTQIANIGLFIASNVLVIWIADLYRNALQQLEKRERERELMLQEMEHRGKNTFAVVEAIVRQSLGRPSEAAETIVGRVRAVSSTNDIINKSPQHRASLDSIIALEFRPYGESRAVREGAFVDLSPYVARQLALVIHELVTNAVKHGALSQPDGRVNISWTCEGPLVRMLWREEGGPTTTAPTAFGFGTRLITVTLKALSGDMVADFGSTGLSCQLWFQRG